jgi:phosphate transport system substrate-binding protein
MTKTLLSLALCLVLLTGCPQPSGSGGAADSGGVVRETVTMKGSDTMVQLGQRWAEVYMQAHPETTIQVTAGGSGNGIAALIDGTTQICQASRPMKDSEKESLKTKRMLDAVETAVALDALAIYVNKENPVTSLTLEQAGKIFRGEITNWKDVGAPAGNIVLYGRENSSGTYVYFKEHVLGNKDFPPKYQALPGTGAVVDAVAKDKGGIGYGGIGFAADIKTLKVAKDAGSMPIEPTMANVHNKTYPISRQLFWYSAGAPMGAAKALQEWVLSPAGQKVVEEQGFYPLQAH